MNEIRITAEPLPLRAGASKQRYEVRHVVGDWWQVIIESTSDPLTNAARHFLDRGADPETRLVYLGDGGRELVNGKLGLLAELAVLEGRNSGPRFVKYRPVMETEDD